MFRGGKSTTVEIVAVCLTIVYGTEGIGSTTVEIVAVCLTSPITKYYKSSTTVEIVAVCLTTSTMADSKVIYDSRNCGGVSDEEGTKVFLTHLRQ